MKKTIICISLILITVIALTAVWATPHAYLSKPEEEIREDILKLTPIGMSMYDVIKVIEHEWQIDDWGFGHGMGNSIDFENGIVRPHVQGPVLPSIGVKSINILLGSYRGNHMVLSDTFVYASWGFDENSELIDVFVSKGTPAF